MWLRILSRFLPLRNLRYRYWLISAAGLVRRLHERESFERVQHVTFASIRHPNPLAGLGAPFLLGPVAGGETVPWRLRRGFGLTGWSVEILRDISNFVVRFDPWVRRTLSMADKIFVTSPETRLLVPSSLRNKVQVELAIGIRKFDGFQREYSVEEAARPARRFLFAARFLHWKGLHLGLAAFAAYGAGGNQSRLTVVGEGPEEKRWRRMAEALGVAERCDWIPWIRQDRLYAMMKEHDALLFPSLRESGGMIVLEALSMGLPVICLKLGGPGVIVNESCGRAVDVAGLGNREVARALTASMREITGDPALWRRLSKGGPGRAMEFEWRGHIRKLLSAGVSDRNPGQ
ncbi:MAG: glycosyltransferase [Alphaproteobacteria bacterium]